ncbi:MAG: serine hydrolase [Saprospiraceae bacterium]|nr:serine hydrolase [Saprospiraceae bacterium]
MKTFATFVLALVASFSSTFLHAQDLNSKIDQLLSAQFPADGPGCTAIVAKGDQVLYRKAFGMAHLELDVPMKPEHVFRIGSITKQFTGAAILKLEEAGKLSVQDDITKYLPDYPTQGHKITIEHLLTHTSGIRSYTDMPEFGSVMRTDKSPEEFIAFFKDQPMDFAPGEKWQYNNSGYFLLGVIIEKVSGMPYDKYIEETFFKPLGMSHSHYGHNAPVFKNRVAGYTLSNDGVVNCDLLSMDLPYAAGSLLSNVDNLYTWYRAVMSGKVLSKKSMEKAHTAYKLNDEKATQYGYGWFLGDVQGSPTIEHGGGINGFITASIYLPKEQVFVAVFSNNEGNSPDVAARKIAGLAIGKPYEWTKILMPEQELAQYAGNFESEDGSQMRSITFENGQLFSQRSGGTKFKIYPFAKDKFFFDESTTTLEFNRAGGKIESVTAHAVSGKETWRKTDKKPTTRTEIQLDQATLQQYVGKYEVQPSFAFTFTLEDGQLMTQATGQPKFPVFAEKKDFFFLKVVEAQIEFFRNDAGVVERLVLYQGGQKIPALKK